MKPSRRVLTCAEVKGLDTRGEIDSSTLIEWDPKEDTWNLASDSFYLKKAAAMTGLTVEESKNDVRMRAEILAVLANEGKRSFSEVTQVIRDYVRTPAAVREAIVGGTHA